MTDAQIVAAWTAGESLEAIALRAGKTVEKIKDIIARWEDSEGLVKFTTRDGRVCWMRATRWED